MIEKGFDLRGTVEILNIEERIPREHLLRKIDSAVDFEYIYALVQEQYSQTTGRKSIDPVAIFKIVLQHLSGIPRPPLRHHQQGRISGIQKPPLPLCVLRKTSALHPEPSLPEDRDSAYLSRLHRQGRGYPPFPRWAGFLLLAQPDNRTGFCGR